VSRRLILAFRPAPPRWGVGLLALLFLALASLHATTAAAGVGFGGHEYVAAPSVSPWRHTPLLTPSLVGRLDAQPTRVTAIQRSEWWGGPTVTSTGETVTLYVSSSFAVNEATRVGWANFFASLYHGSEISTVTIYQAPLYEVRAFCGGGSALGCYLRTQRTLFFPGDGDPAANQVIGAHEYGHHVALSRRNDPWNPGDWGPKRWASYIGVCARTAAGTLFPDDEGAHYTLNPGEGFAEAYMDLNKQRGGTWAALPSPVDASLAPDGGALAAILADVQQPWQGPTQTTWNGQFVRPLPPLVPLEGAVRRGTKLWLHNASGRPVRSLRSRSYVLTVTDESTKDDFHLRGPGVDRKTGVPGTGYAVWRLALKPGTYRFFSDAHPKVGSTFTVTPPTSVPVNAGSAALPFQEQTITTPLDGVFQATVNGTAGASLELIDAATGQTLVAPTPGAISFTLCGQRSLVLRLAAAQPGSFQVSMAMP
jgi:hypothetical protein